MNRTGVGNLQFVRSKSYKVRSSPSGTFDVSITQRLLVQLRCNWKVFVDNYLDGGYHVAHAHKGLGEFFLVASRDCSLTAP